MNLFNIQTAKAFNDFLERLRAAQNPKEHGTTNPVFCVFTRKPIYGIDADYHDSPDLVIQNLDTDEEFTDIVAFYKEACSDVREFLDGVDGEIPFMDLDYSDQVSAIKDLRYADDVGQFAITRRIFVDEWVSQHFTPEAAQAFIKRKGHDYPYGLRMEVKSSYWCNEYNQLMELMLNGQLDYVDPATLTYFQETYIRITKAHNASVFWAIIAAVLFAVQFLLVVF